MANNLDKSPPLADLLKFVVLAGIVSGIAMLVNMRLFQSILKEK